MFKLSAQFQNILKQSILCIYAQQGIGNGRKNTDKARPDVSSIVIDYIQLTPIIFVKISVTWGDF